jgi:hypothetical protein
MRKISIYIISLLAVSHCNPVMAQVKVQVKVQDSVLIPLKIRAGIEISGPVIYFTDNNNLNYEGFVSGDFNEKISLFFGGGYSNYKYSQYNYGYLSHGVFIKAGADFNLFKPEMAIGKYWGGIGVHYGISSFTSETPHFKQNNYWGSASSSIAPDRRMGHFLEFSPGFRAELFRNFSIGWSISIRRIIYSGKDKDLKPVYIPGYGDGGKTFSTGINYFIVYSIPFKKIRVPIKIEEPEEPADTEIPAGESSIR